MRGSQGAAYKPDRFGRRKLLDISWDANGCNQSGAVIHGLAAGGRSWPKAGPDARKTSARHGRLAQLSSLRQINNGRFIYRLRGRVSVHS